MSPVWIAVAFLFAVGFGILLCIAIGFAWMLYQQMRKLQQSAEIQTKTVQELLEDGTFRRISKGCNDLANGFPDMIAASKEFSAAVNNMAKIFFREEPAQQRTTTPQAEPESGFFTYSEEKAAQNEVTAKHREERVELSKEEMAGMRTAPEKVPEDILPPRPSDDNKLTAESF